MSIIAMEKAHDLSLEDRNFEARQVLVDAIAEAKKLEQAQQAEKQEPVAWMQKDVLPLTHIIKAVVRRERDETHTIPLYTSPPVASNDTSQHRVDETAKQRHEPVIDKAAAIRIATALGWTPPRQPLTDEEIELLEWATTTLSSFSAPDRPVGAWKFVYMPKLGELRNLVQKHKAAHGIKGEA